MKMTKEELIRIIKEEIKNKKTKPVKYTVQPVEYPTSTGKTNAANDIEELYRSVYGIGDSVMQVSARIDGIQKAIKELSGDLEHTRKGLKHVLARPYYSSIDPEDPYIEALQGLIEANSEMIYAIYDGLPEDIVADIEAAMPPEEEEEGGE